MTEMAQRGRARARQELLALLLVLGSLCGPSAASARTRPGKHVTQSAQHALAENLNGLPAPSDLEPPPAGEPGAPDYATLTQRLEASYRQSSAPELLFQFGILAKLLAKSVEAHDLMRRFLADPLTAPGSVGQEEAERIVALPRPPCGEVQVVADEEGLILVDGHVVGALPLALPLLVPIGSHVISLEMPDKTMKATVDVLDGRGAEMRFNRESGAVVVTLPPAVILLTEYAGAKAPADLVRRLQETAEKTIQKARLAIYGKEAALRRAPKLASCVTTLSCQSQLALQTDADYVLPLRIERRLPAEEYVLNVQLVDAEADDVAAMAQVSCTRCTPEQLIAKLGNALQGLLKEGPGRPRGKLSITSDPPGAELRMGDRVLGQTPYEHIAFVGTRELQLRKPEYAPETVRVVVKEGKKATAAVALSFMEPAPQPLRLDPASQPLRRPRWRLITGGVALGLGILLAGVGISGIVIDNQCVSPPELPVLNCRDRFDTLGIGAGLLGTGAALSVAGAVLIALPPRRAASSRSLSDRGVPDEK